MCYPGQVTQSQTSAAIWPFKPTATTYSLGTSTWNASAGYYDLKSGSSCGSAGQRSGKMYMVCTPLQSNAAAYMSEPSTCQYVLTWKTPSACPGPVGALVNAAGNCLDVANAGRSSGTAVQSYTCKANEPAQTWIQQANGVYLNPNSNMCLDVSSGSATGNLQIYNCNGTPSQKWTTPANFPGAFVSAIGSNNCLDSAGGAVGARAKLAPCNNGASQQWTFRDNSVSTVSALPTTIGINTAAIGTVG